MLLSSGVNQLSLKCRSWMRVSMAARLGPAATHLHRMRSAHAGSTAQLYGESQCTVCADKGTGMLGMLAASAWLLFSMPFMQTHYCHLLERFGTDNIFVLAA